MSESNLFPSPDHLSEIAGAIDRLYEEVLFRCTRLPGQEKSRPQLLGWHGGSRILKSRKIHIAAVPLVDELLTLFFGDSGKPREAASEPFVSSVSRPNENLIAFHLSGWPADLQDLLFALEEVLDAVRWYFGQSPPIQCTTADPLPDNLPYCRPVPSHKADFPTEHYETFQYIASELRRMVERGKDNQVGKKPVLEIKAWGELGIGIDSDSYWAVSPCPEVGSAFAKRDAVKLPLKGKRWKILLNALAQSESGDTTTRVDIIRGFGYPPPAANVPRFAKASQKALINGTTQELQTQGNLVLRRLNQSLAELASELRKHVSGPKGREGKALWVEGENVRSGFTVRPLVRDTQRRFRFGRRRGDYG